MVFCFGSLATLEPGQPKAEVSLTQLQGKHQLRIEQGLRKPLRNSPPRSITPAWRLAQRCASCFPFFQLTGQFISLGKAKLS